MSEKSGPKIVDPQNGKVLRKFGNFDDRTQLSENYEMFMAEVEKRSRAKVEAKGFPHNPQYFKDISLANITRCLSKYHGSRLMYSSQRFCKEVERTWITCHIERDNWTNINEPLRIRAEIMDGIWGAQPNKEFLELLYNMDIQHQYLLSYYIFDSETKKAYCHHADLVTHEEIDLNGIGFTPRQIIMDLTILKADPKKLKWMCHGCNGAEQDCKLKLCAGCRYVRYCSLDCQRKSWSLEHSIHCSILKKLRVQRDTVDTKK